MKQSGFLQLNWRDALNGLLTAIAGSVVSIISNSVNAGNFQIDLTALWHGAMVAGVGYIARKLLTPATNVKA